ncbi:MAG: hypothetical protein ACYS0K_12760 [Planctomycetota bacterium]|jgi:hypothetical protein
MKSYFRNGRWFGAFLLIAVALCITSAGTAQAGDAKGEGVFLIISLEQKTFDRTITDGSATVFVQIGTLTAGDTIYNTRYKKKPNVTIKLPGKYKWNDLDEHAFTVLGSFNAPLASVHLGSPVDPESNTIPRKVQEAFFLASPELTDELEGQLPTTVEIAQFIYDTAVGIAEAEGPNLPAPPSEPPLEDPVPAPTTMEEWFEYDYGEGDPRGRPLTPDMILQNIFLTEPGQEIDTTGDVYAEAEGDFLPHNPGPRLFGFEVKIEKSKKAKVDSDTELDVVIDIKPGNADNVIEKTDQGVVWTAILTTTKTVTKDGKDIEVVVFNAATEMDESWRTVYLGDAPATARKIEDVNHDGHKDITLKFRVNKISGLVPGTTLVTLTGKTDSTPGPSMNIIGSDYVTIKK